MIDILNHYEKQLVLYSKGWFKVTDMIEDIKVIYSKYYDTDPKYVGKVDVLRYVGRVFYKLKEHDSIRFTEDISIFTELFHRVSVWKDKNNIEVLDVIEYMYGQISNIPVLNIIELGDPDYSILPEKERVNTK